MKKLFMAIKYYCLALATESWSFFILVCAAIGGMNILTQKPVSRKSQ